MANRRRNTRFRLPMHAVVAWGAQSVPARLQDISARGMFLSTEFLLPSRQLVSVRFPDLPEGDALSLHAMVVYVSDGRGPRPMGAGLELYANTKEKVARWHKVVTEARKMAKLGIVPDSRTSGGMSRRGYDRFSAILEVRMKSANELFTMYSRDISEGGMFIATSLDVPIGAEILLDVVHPKTERVMHLIAVVVRHERMGKRAGLAVEFLDMDERRRDAFWKFASSTVDFSKLNG